MPTASPHGVVCFTIAQQMVINRTKDDEPVAVTTAGGKTVKNVTPKKK